MVKRHKFLYYFDYGDNHGVEVEVVDIQPQAQSEDYLDQEGSNKSTGGPS